MQGTVAIIDYGVGNVQSVSSALSFLKYRNVITRSPERIRQAAAIILPGVGAFSEAVMGLQRFDLFEVLNDEVQIRGKPILGICLGMQVLGNSSQESPGCRGLGWIDFDVVRFPTRANLKVPHVGWNTISADCEHHLFRNMGQEPHFYFDHSYYVDGAADVVAAHCGYGTDFAAAVVRKNIAGVQFHPEKSQVNGLKLFRNFFNHFGV